ncbi:MAG: 1,4-alpha-glucan branching enzyme [Deltaproteobacteria bacterium RBG_16_64_85]|nr:MAG: 1,4-alpha-glucan branching enzyme [Deltaproteobacteria bacterium RBG_16_64_85]
MVGTLRKQDIELLADARHWDPFSVLGPHVVDINQRKAVAIRAVLPLASHAYVVTFKEGKKRRTEMERLHPDGVFEAVFPRIREFFPYRIEIVDYEGHRWQQDDPYAFGCVLTDFDIHLLHEGTHLDQYARLGSHLARVSEVNGVTFAVWAPNAERVSVVGNFNHWDGRTHPMRSRGESGIWEIFIPGLTEGEIYKFEIRTREAGALFTKSDPFAFRFEPPPRTGSIVCSIDGYAWGDADWMAARASRNPLEAPMATYEVHLGSWKRKPEEGNRYLTYLELADELVPYVRDMGYTHIELLPVSEHPFDGSWGYQTLGYFAPTARFGNPADFMAFVDRCHQEGIGVILDWVPAHFPKDGHGLNYFDGSHLYEHADPRKGEHHDWGTLVFNYGRREVANFLLSNALFWLEKYHIDGLRVDAVASMIYLDYSRNPGDWIPNEFGGRENLEAIAFLKRMNELVHAKHPGAITLAEESTAWPMVSRPVYLGGLGFTFKWNMGWMHDMLGFIEKEPIYRKFHFGTLTFSLLYAFHENFVLPFSHDEVVHQKRALLDKMPGDLWQKFANLRLLYAYMYAHPGKKLLFMGCEFGQWEEWNHDVSLSWHLLQWDSHRGLQTMVRDLNRIYKASPALHEVDFRPEGFEWIGFRDVDHSIVSFLRRAKTPDDFLVCAFNFTPVLRKDYRVGVPAPGLYRAVFNSDSEFYGGSNADGVDATPAEDVSWNGRPWSVKLSLPPLGALFLRRSE